MSGTERMPESRRPGLTRFHAALGMLAGVVAVFSSASLHAQTLTQALAEAYNTNPQLLAQRADGFCRKHPGGCSGRRQQLGVRYHPAHKSQFRRARGRGLATRRS